MQYPAKITCAGSGFMVTFRDIPEAMTGANTFYKRGRWHRRLYSGFRQTKRPKEKPVSDWTH